MILRGTITDSCELWPTKIIECDAITATVRLDGLSYSTESEKNAAENHIGELFLILTGSH